jgi:hypothetical protein
MMYDESLDDFIVGGGTSQLPVKFAPQGPPPMIPVLIELPPSDSSVSRGSRSWRLEHVPREIGLKWVPQNQDAPMEEASSTIFHGEESLLPETISDTIWQSHFRHQDTELADRKETEILLKLYLQSCGRWPVIHDRWVSHPVYGSRGRSLEALKSRFSRLVTKLVEIDLFQRKKPSSNSERLQVSQQLKYLPLFTMKYNEKNEYLRRIFLLNSDKRGSSPELDKLMNELTRIPTLNMKKRLPSLKAPLTPGPHAASSLMANVQAELSASEYLRVKSLLKSVGLDRAGMSITPKIARLLSVVEREAATLLIMRDSLQRKKQELEILRSSGGAGVTRLRNAPQSTPPSTTAALTPVTVSAPLLSAPAAQASQSLSLSQQKRKR